MASERIQRQIERLLDEAESAAAQREWAIARERAEHALTFDPENVDALALLQAAQRGLAAERPAETPTPSSDGPVAPATPGARLGESASPASFVRGRYQVVRFLGEGGKKRVYLAHDTQLDREVAFALLKSDGLDAESLVRIRREAQAMGRLGDHPQIVTVFDIGEEQGQPYLVSQYMAGGSLQALIEQAEDHRLAIDAALNIAKQVCQALEHAHSHGVIHRDLKPANVWLAGPTPSPLAGEGSGEGASHLTAKLGDFGLAMAVDRSRLTQAGMMVGTVAYMAPEQAIGGEVTPRSDLYSLGAMLYELLTGRPPFVGDESVAIITQHLNTPPVAPSWHQPDLPAGLEALILRLLEKDPTKRPASATEVRRILADVVSPSPARGEGVLSPPPTAGEGEGEGGHAVGGRPNPLYRRVFVGREGELQQAQEAFDRALSGQGSLLMVVGELGIGKTALCEQLSTYVAVRGGKTLVGHCYEEGSLSLPYLAFVEALRTYVLAREPDGLKRDLGSGGAEVARIVSEIRERIPQSEFRTPQSSDPEEERWRLLEAVATFLRNASSVQPLVVVLEDLHWADRGTLDLLVHLARNLAGARLLVVGTYRDVEVDRAHPLSATLAELRRAGEFARVLLRGLTVDEVSRMLNAIRGQEVPWSRAEAIHRQTEGNPLFVQEVLRYLVEEGLVVREGGHYVRADDGTPEGGIPEGLRDVVGRRLSRLSEKTNQVLSVAAVVGREFRLDVLQKVAALPEDEIDSALQEAMGRAILEERPALGVLAFRFTHAFFRQTLYEEIFASRRLRLHQQVARALESLYAPGGRPGGEQEAPLDRPAARTAGRLEEHASELAEHFAQSTDPADLAKALGYSELAAKRASGVFAYREAARFLEMALKIQDVLDPDDKARRCDLLLALGEAMLPMEDPRQVADTVAAEGFALAAELGDTPRAARAAVQALEAFMRTGADAVVWSSPQVRDWVVRADRSAGLGTIERVYADLAQGVAPGGTAGGPAAAHVFLRRAVERAVEMGNNAPFFAAASWALARLAALRDHDLLERLAQAVTTQPREGARSRDLAQCLFSAAPILLGRGERQLAEEAWREEAQLAERTRDAALIVRAMVGPALLAFIDGRLEEAVSLREVHRAQAHQLGVVEAFPPYRGLLLLGRTEGLLEMFAGPTRQTQSTRAVILGHVGRANEARAIRPSFGDIGSDEDESGVHILLRLLEASVLSNDADTVQVLQRRLKPLAGVVHVGHGVSIGRLLGDGARLLGQPGEASGYYTQALAVCEKIRFRPEIALIRLAQAELGLEEAKGDQRSAISGQETKTKMKADELKAECAALLDFAIKEFEAMKMRPALERARALENQIRG